MAVVKKTKKTRAKKRAAVKRVRVYINARFNNTIITITDTKGGKLCQSSAGACGQKGSRKGTAFAATMACEAALTVAKETYGAEEAEIHVRGPGQGRDSASKAVRDANLHVVMIVDGTRVPHNGCRPPKERRV